LYLAGVLEARWDQGGTEPADDYIFFYGNRNTDYHLGTCFIVHKGIISTVKRVEFVSDRIAGVTGIQEMCAIEIIKKGTKTKKKKGKTNVRKRNMLK
jgi:hypothetical protein